MIEDYGYQLGRRCKTGQKDKDSGVLLIVAAGDQKVRIEVGYGLEGALTDAATRVIIENSILPRFRTGDLPGGIKRGVADIVWLAIVLGLDLVGFLIVCAVTKGGGIYQAIMQIPFVMALSGRGRSSRGKSSFSSGGGSFRDGASSGSW